MSILQAEIRVNVERFHSRHILGNCALRPSGDMGTDRGAENPFLVFLLMERSKRSPEEEQAKLTQREEGNLGMSGQHHASRQTIAITQYNTST